MIEDLNSRHGTWVNGERIARHVLRNSDRIEFGVRDSYPAHVFDRITARSTGFWIRSRSTSHSGALGPNNLAKLRSLVEVARALQNSLSTQEVLTAVVDAALAVTGCERGFLTAAQRTPELEVSVARDRVGKALEAHELRVPTSVIRRALNSRRDLLSMSFDPLEQQGVRPEMSVAALELR